MRKVIAKIDLENIVSNANSFLSLTGKPLCAVVKANAYGHGAEETVNALSGVADVFAVSLLCEALAIRVAACGKDILILTPPCDEKDIITAAKNSFVLTVGDLDTVNSIIRLSASLALPIRVHLKVNTGMNRYGMDERDLQTACKKLSLQSGVFVEGVYSHLYDYTLESASNQRGRFLEMQSLVKSFFPNAICHLSATYGTLLGRDFHFDMSRIGLGLYGYLPSGAQDIEKKVIHKLSLKKAMSVWAEVSAERVYQTGGVGYGKAVAPVCSKLSVLRCGYADGFLRARENGIFAFEKNANNLCMDACIQIDEKRKGDWTPILLDAENTAACTGTISYEVLCAATRRAEMVYDDVTFCGGQSNKGRGNAEETTSRPYERTPRQ